MIFLPGLAVIFVGVVGDPTTKVDHQVEAVVRDAHVERAPMAAATVRTLVRHGDGTRDIVRRLHVDGVVGGELVNDHGHLALRLVIYAADGGLKSFSEVPLGGKTLSSDELEVLRSNLGDEIEALIAVAPTPTPTPAPTPAPTPSLTPAPRAPSPPPAPPPPPRIAAPPSSPTVIEPDGPTTPEVAPTPAAAEDSDSVRPEELEAMASATEGVAAATTAVAESSLHLRAAIGLGVSGRNFAPGVTTVPGYASTPVGAIHFAGSAQPTAHTTFAVLAERTLQMATPTQSTGMASTTISRWEVVGTYKVSRGAVDVAPLAGLGRRSFAIDSTDPTRSPDGDYNYLLLGVGVSSALGKHVSLHGTFAFEPVVSGVEPTEMAFGEARRWGLDVGAAIELRPFAHLFARVAADYQRFSWTWDQAGSRGDGGATDAYPSGMLAIGAEY
jgi:hypothetical protein